jgi:glutamine synthetase
MENSNSVLNNFLADHPTVENVEFVVVDPSGVTRGKWAPVSSLKKAFSTGINFPLSLHGLDVWGNEVPDTGLHISSGDKDGFGVAVESSLSAVPWGHAAPIVCDSQQKAKTAQVILQMQSPDHQPFGGCARTVLENAVARLGEDGLHPVCAFELEFHLLKDDGSAFEIAEDSGIADAQFMYGLDALAEKLPVFADIRNAAQWANLPLDTIVKEAGPGQFEINLVHRDEPLKAADDVVLLKRIVRECARLHNLKATFMAKPFLDQPGNGMHVHISLLNGEGDNIFSLANGNEKLTHAAAGLVQTMAEMTLVFVNSRNGFRRMAPGSYAPTRANWGENNRSVAVRLPAAEGAARRLEHRVSGADANPYLVLAGLLEGMRAGLQVGKGPSLPALEGNAYDEDTSNRGEPLPNVMSDALHQFKSSAFADQALGKEMVHILSAIKQAEITRFEQDMSELERQTYL